MDGLSASETEIVNKLTGNGDVAISVLFRIRRKRWPHEHEDNRKQQQVVGAATSLINRKFRDKGRKLKIVPGEKRGTYRLTRLRP
jgi:hypothetical protein